MTYKGKLPKGFTFLEYEEIIIRHKILDNLIRESSNIYNYLIEIPPVSLLDVASHGANLLGEKVFTLKDKKGRALVLNPDSQAQIFNHYLSCKTKRNVRYTWISPTFRYRRIANRYFFQVGFASVNHDENFEMQELFLCLQAFIRFLYSCIDQRLTLRVVYPSLILEILGYATRTEQEAQSLFQHFRNLNYKDCKELLLIVLDQSSHKESLLKILEENSFSDQVLEILSQYRHGLNLKKFIEIIRTNESDINVKYDIQHVYSSETLSGLGFILEIEGSKIGDGGIYNSYGLMYDKRINTVISVCSGLNPVSRFMKGIPRYKIGVLVEEYEKDIYSINILSERLSSKDFVVNALPKNDNNFKYFKENMNLIIVIRRVSTEQFSGKIICVMPPETNYFNDCSIETLLSLCLAQIQMK